MVFGTLYLIRIRNVDVGTGLNLIHSISKDFNIDTVTIKKLHDGGISALI